MKATGWNDGKHNLNGKGYGIRIGKVNRDKFFERTWSDFHLSIESKECIIVKITPGFWNECTEFRDKRIGLWLIKNNLAPWEKGKTPKFVLSKIGVQKFLLEKI